MNKLPFIASTVLPIVLTTLATPAFAQTYGPARPGQSYLPPGSWQPGQVAGQGYITRSFTGADGCIYREIFDVTANGPQLVETIQD